MRKLFGWPLFLVLALVLFALPAFAAPTVPVHITWAAQPTTLNNGTVIDPDIDLEEYCIYWRDPDIAGQKFDDARRYCTGDPTIRDVYFTSITNIPTDRLPYLIFAVTAVGPTEKEGGYSPEGGFPLGIIPKTMNNGPVIAGAPAAP